MLHIAFGTLEVDKVNFFEFNTAPFSLHIFVFLIADRYLFRLFAQDVHAAQIGTVWT